MLELEAAAMVRPVFLRAALLGVPVCSAPPAAAPHVSTVLTTKYCGRSKAVRAISGLGTRRYCS